MEDRLASDEKATKTPVVLTDKAVDSLAWLRIGAYATATVGAVGTGISKIWDIFYDNFKSYPLIAEARNQRHKERDTLCQTAKAQNFTRKEFTQKYKAIEDNFGHEFNTIIKDNFGIESEGFTGAIKGTWHRFEALGKYTQAKIAFGTVAAIATGVGGIIVIEKMLQRDHKAQQLLTQLDAQEQNNAR